MQSNLVAILCRIPQSEAQLSRDAKKGGAGGLRCIPGATLAGAIRMTRSVEDSIGGIWVKSEDYQDRSITGPFAFGFANVGIMNSFVGESPIEADLLVTERARACR